MLKLIQIEFCKLRRKKLIWLMLLSAFVMPFFAFLYFGYLGRTDIDPVIFYKWSAFGYTLFIILPFMLGLLSVMLMHDENSYDMLKQFWIVPLSKMKFLFSKFFIVLIYSIFFMLITALASILFSVIPKYVILEWHSVVFLLKKCLEIAILVAFAILPVFSISVSQKGYIFTICIILIYVFSGFLITPVFSYLHPLSCISVIITRNGEIPGVTLPQVHVPLALLSICVWDIVSVVFAKMTLGKRK